MIFRLQAANWIANFMVATFQSQTEVSSKVVSTETKKESCVKLKIMRGLPITNRSPMNFQLQTRGCVYLHAFRKFVAFIGAYYCDGIWEFNPFQEERLQQRLCNERSHRSVLRGST